VVAYDLYLIFSAYVATARTPNSGLQLPGILTLFRLKSPKKATFSSKILPELPKNLPESSFVLMQTSYLLMTTPVSARVLTQK